VNRKRSTFNARAPVFPISVGVARRFTCRDESGAAPVQTLRSVRRDGYRASFLGALVLTEWTTRKGFSSVSAASSSFSNKPRLQQAGSRACKSARPSPHEIRALQEFPRRSQRRSRTNQRALSKPSRWKTDRVVHSVTHAQKGSLDTHLGAQSGALCTGAARSSAACEFSGNATLMDTGARA